MKKVLYASFAALLMMVTVNVNAAVHSYDDWVTDGGFGTKTKESDNVTKVTGQSNEGFGQVTGPYSKASKAKLVDGINEQVNIELDLDEISQGKFFEATVSLNENANSSEELTEKVVMTQKDGNVLKVTAGWYNNNPIGEIKESGLYTYQWHYFIKNAKAYINFSILHSGKTVVTTGDVEMTEITDLASKKDIQVRSVWLNNIQTDDGLLLYTKLPGLTVDGKGEEGKVEDKDFNDVVNEALKDEKFKDLFDTDGDVTVELEAKEAEATPEEVKKFEAALEDGIIGGFLDIDILVLKDGEEARNITELSKKIQLSAKLPELPEVEKGYTRTYYILREHNGEVEKLDATLSKDGKSLIFSSDKFSKYAVVYVDTKAAEEDAPETLDAGHIYVGLALISLGAMAVSVRKLRNN